MKKVDLKKIANDVSKTISKRSPEILTGIGIAGMLTSTVLAVKATPKACRLIEEHKKFISDGMDDPCDYEDIKLSPVEVFKVAWKPYIPTAVTSAVSVVCLIGASSVNAKRNAALATAYELSRNALSEYKDKVVETIGEKKEKQVRDAINKDRVEKNPVKNNEVIVTKAGDTLFLDVISKRYFKSDMDKIKAARNELNSKLISFDYVSLNEFYEEIGLEPTSIGDDIGWNMGRDGLIEIEYEAQIADDGTPCIVIDYRVAPRYDYSKLM